MILGPRAAPTAHHRRRHRRLAAIPSPAHVPARVALAVRPQPASRGAGPRRRPPTSGRARGAFLCSRAQVRAPAPEERSQGWKSHSYMQEGRVDIDAVAA